VILASRKTGGRDDEPVFRDNKGLHITKEEYYKSKQQKVEEKQKEIEIEWSKGLAQKLSC